MVRRFSNPSAFRGSAGDEKEERKIYSLGLRDQRYGSGGDVEKQNYGGEEDDYGDDHDDDDSLHHEASPLNGFHNRQSTPSSPLPFSSSSPDGEKSSSPPRRSTRRRPTPVFHDRTKLPKHLKTVPAIRMRIPYIWLQRLCLVVFICIILSGIVLWKATSVTSHSKLPSNDKQRTWEAFERLGRFYGGVRSLVPRNENTPEYTGNGTKTFTTKSTYFDIGDADYETLLGKGPSLESAIFDPYPNYTSPEYIEQYGVKHDCFLDAGGKVDIPRLRYYPGVPAAFPDAPVGSNKMLGIEDDLCFDRFGRLGAYGYGYAKDLGGTGAGVNGGDRTDIDPIWEDIPPVDFRKMKWGEAQDRCVNSNLHRFTRQAASKAESNSSKIEDERGSERVQRSVLLLRTWYGYHYTPETIIYLRSLIAELSLLSGGEYTVHFLIHVKDDDIPIWSDKETHDNILKEALPEEFEGMGTLWSEKQMELIYWGMEQRNPKRSVYGNYRSSFMPVQFWSYQHPEFDFVWNWEMDARNTGSWYHFFEKVSQWAKKQPRKGLWERNARYYVPAAHGDWEEFKHRVHIQTEEGTALTGDVHKSLGKVANANNNEESGQQLPQRKREKPIWGPERPDQDDIMEVEGEGIPIDSEDEDDYQWGVDEDADLIVLNPLFDPEGTTWLLRDDATGYNRKFMGPPPRRSAIIAASRLSRKLLLTMHREGVFKKHTMFTEMWPASCALHHGFKAVYAPHSMYFDRRWPTSYLEAVFNAGKNGATGGARTSVYGDREHNFFGTTWFYSARHGTNLWIRWLGLKGAGEKGGEDWEVMNEGRMCLPPMLIHPVKQVDMSLTSEYTWKGENLTWKRADDTQA
ncbi:hypothetical protein AAP_03668 [Ascosphaera apis ARSEF 7405]|uniref:Major facilitator superfamily transporter n=1 Tax=Ascosphaera apis ARSEF 7405 TaxID=392613 RepID=A0A162I9Z6_9EURO|nr:hypothetical protein AAP_03668 [Ascosphaera apis ARSEF 7405]